MANNYKLAMAVVALYDITSSQADTWTDEDEIIQKAAFGIYEAADCRPETFARYMIDAGCTNVPLIAAFTDITETLAYRHYKDSLASKPASI